VVVVEVERIAEACGDAVPRYEDAGQGDLLDQWTGGKDATALVADRAQHHRASSDDLPVLPAPAATGRRIRAEQANRPTG
jgi:hypothetical protein